MPVYNKLTAYADTNVTDFYLDLMVNRPIPAVKGDVLFTITKTYDLQPVLLAYDLYDDADLWWVFAQRNPDVLVNPLMDFKLGTEIYLPNIETLKTNLGF